MKWWRAYVGLSTDAKIAEAATIAGQGRIYTIGVWHCVLENAAELENGGAFNVTPRRLAAQLGEDPAPVERVFEAMGVVGLIKETLVIAWTKRQPPSDAERQRAARGRKRNVTDASQHVTDTTEHVRDSHGHVTPRAEQSRAEELTSVPSVNSQQLASLVVLPDRKKNGQKKRASDDAIVEDFLEAWDDLAASEGLPACKAVTQARRARILQRAENLTKALHYPDAHTGFADLFARIRSSPFLLGRAPPRHGAQPFKIDLDWATQESNFLKIMEDKYNARQRQGRT